MGDNHRAGDLLTGLFIGTGIGVAAALLLAPQSGQETREVIRDRGLEFKSRAENMGEEGRERAQDLAEEARHRAEQAHARGRHVIEEQGTRLHQALDQGKEAYEKKRDELTARF
jgi:gas vesicle protein